MTCINLTYYELGPAIILKQPMSVPNMDQISFDLNSKLLVIMHCLSKIAKKLLRLRLSFLIFRSGVIYKLNR